MDALQDHPIAAVFPLLEGEAADALAGDIANNGQREPIVIHLTTSQRAMIAAELANTRHGGDRCSAQAANLQLITRADAAKKLNVSKRSVNEAAAVQVHGTPELQEAVRRGQMSVSAAAAMCLICARSGSSASISRESETSVANALASAVQGKREVNVTGGRIDVLSATQLIEVKRAKLWRTALGQVHGYGQFYPTHEKRIHLFDVPEGFDFTTVFNACSATGVVLTWQIERLNDHACREGQA